MPPALRAVQILMTLTAFEFFGEVPQSRQDSGVATLERSANSSRRTFDPARGEPVVDECLGFR